MRSRLIALSLLAGIIVPATSALATLPHQPTGSIGIRLVGVPADSRDDPRARSYIVDRLAPGTSIRRRVEISNSTRSTADVAVYPAAASLRRGRFGFAPSHSRNELSSWTSVSRDVLRLLPGTKAFETVTIKVPKEASSGERYAVVWAEVSAPAPAAGGVTLVNRVGIRMYLSIGPGGAPPSNFVIGSLTAERSATGEPLVVAKIHNSGQRTLDISGNLTLSKGPGGLRAGPFPVKLGTALAPDDSEPATVRLDKRLPRGPWRAHMRLRSGLIQRVAVATIRFPRHAGAAKPPTARAVPAGSHHLILVVIILLVLLAVAAFALLLSRRVRRGRGEDAYAVAAELQRQLADRHERGGWYRVTPAEVRQAIGKHSARQAASEAADAGRAALTAEAEAERERGERAQQRRRTRAQTRREKLRAAARLLAAGLTQQAAGRELGVSERTIRRWTKLPGFESELAKARARQERERELAMQRAQQRRADTASQRRVRQHPARERARVSPR